MTIQLTILLTIAPVERTVTVTAEARQGDVLAPDPSRQVLTRDTLLNANPGRPGAPISIPGLPIETASGGIKAPQYFAPGVAGDHGEPIAQYIQVGSFLLPNNLSANAHGNGYADPNILVPATVENVQTDGGAFNVREGNHSENLAVVYGLHSVIEPFITLTGDGRDIDLTTGWSPASGALSWITLQGSYGNDLWQRLTHRKQFKLNAYRSLTRGRHDLVFMGIGYYGFSFVPGLTPLHRPDLGDTIDPRQKDQTHTALVAASDNWRLSAQQQVHLAGFFRTYNLALDSNFGDGLIRQSEFRTVSGGNAADTWQIAPSLTILAGASDQRDAPRRLDLDHYTSTDPTVYGPFQKVTANNVTINDLAPYAALNATLTQRVHLDLGWRHDAIGFDNVDLLVPEHSFDRWAGVNSPKGRLAFLPWKHTSLALSAGEAFFTNDPRIGSATGPTVGPGTLVSRSHNYQLVASQTIAGTDFRVLLGHVTTEASLAKLDPDTGLQFDEGPGRLRFMTISAQRHFQGGMVETSFSKADARDLDTGEPTPEAPRTIFDALAAWSRLPYDLQARGEIEYVGTKPLGNGFAGVPVREWRFAASRPWAEGRMDLGLNLLWASGYTGQTTEVLALPGEGTPFERIVGVRQPSSISLSYSYRFRSRSAP